MLMAGLSFARPLTESFIDYRGSPIRVKRSASLVVLGLILAMGGKRTPERLIVDILLRHRTIQLPNLDMPDQLWIHQSRVDAHAIGRRVHCRPMGDAAADEAAMELSCLVAPHVNVGRGRLREMHLAWRVIGPQHAIPAADRTVAFRDVLRSDVDF